MGSNLLLTNFKTYPGREFWLSQSRSKALVISYTLMATIASQKVLMNNRKNFCSKVDGGPLLIFNAVLLFFRY